MRLESHLSGSGFFGSGFFGSGSAGSDSTRSCCSWLQFLRPNSSGINFSRSGSQNQVSFTRKFLFLLILLWLPWSAGQAGSVLVLVHGYLGSGQSFVQSGVVAELANSGWHYGGDWTMGPTGQPQLRGPGSNHPDTVYTVTLPANAPLIIQADWLSLMRRAIGQQHPDQPMILVGHSAGGVVARLSLVRGGKARVEHLITIASPHLGTERALQALDATQGGGFFGPVRRMFTRQAIGGSNYDTLRASQSVLIDLTPPAPGNLLGWLNHQQHPNIAYDAVIRDTGLRMGGDMLVPAFSQDLNNVPALRGRAQVVLSPAEHWLQRADATIILDRIKHRASGECIAPARC